MQFMTTLQIADLFAVSGRRVEQLISSGQLQAREVGGVWEVDHRELTTLAARIGAESADHRPSK